MESPAEGFDAFLPLAETVVDSVRWEKVESYRVDHND